MNLHAISLAQSVQYVSGLMHAESATTIPIVRLNAGEKSWNETHWRIPLEKLSTADDGKFAFMVAPCDGPTTLALVIAKRRSACRRTGSSQFLVLCPQLCPNYMTLCVRSGKITL
jgi:hypothetical protein